MIFNKTEEQEKIYLRKMISLIKEAAAGSDSFIKDQSQLLNEQKDYLRQNKAEIDAQEVRSMRESILNTLAVGEGVIAKRIRLEKLSDIPYFGRIDFKEKQTDGKPVPLYIGVHTFFDPNDKKNLIYDWRAPVSSMYYDHETGEASYDSPTVKVTGDISLKRQYRIRKGIMEYMIESSLTVHDDILQKELSAGADDKMRNIVATIQREQNRIIRDEDSHTLIIQGVAGSGKTSVALHRIAYLLYAHKGTISSKDILIISPNKVFADYISNVLPELGEEAVPEIGMDRILSEVLENKYKYRTFFDQTAELLDRPTAGFIERIRYKSSFEFISRIDKFILHMENTYFRSTDVRLTKYITVPAEYIDEQFRRFYRYPIRQRFEVMTDYILEMMRVQYFTDVTTAERNTLKKEIRAMFAGNNDLQVYKDFYMWSGVPEMFKMRKGHTLEYADLAPLAYFRIALDGLKAYSKVKHLLIDEMQDYSPVQYKILLKLFPCRKTILGDAGQSVNPYGSSTADMIRKALVNGEIMKLCKSYRSTCEITEFAQKIRTDKELEAIERHGEMPRMIRYSTPEKEFAGIAERIADFQKSDHTSLGIVCKDERQAGELYDYLRSMIGNIYFLSHQSSTFAKGVVITFAHMAKGLEFDDVIVPNATDKNYCSESDRGILYVAVTRAMHRLTLTYSGKFTELVGK